jgi:hypothetical protein
VSIYPGYAAKRVAAKGVLATEASSHIEAPEGLATTRGRRDSPHDPMILFTDHSKQLIFKLKIIMNLINVYR